MSEELLVRHCSPTLAGMKTGNMFSCSCRSREDVKNYVRAMNRLLNGRGLRVLPLKCEKGHALIYVYRPDRLSDDLREDLAVEILASCGYTSKDPTKCLIRLMKRLKAEEGFPHEIGLFLGYPPEDVRGFIEYGAQNYKCVGAWKVYGDEEAAKQLFAKYRRCTEIYEKRFRHGSTLEQLTVRS